MSISAVNLAVQAYREVALAEFLLEKRKRRLQRSLLKVAVDGTVEDRTEYARRTKEIDQEFQDKVTKLNALGL